MAGAVVLGPIGLVAVLLLSTAPRAVVSTISYPLATESAAGADLGACIAIGLLNGTWAIGLVLAPLIAGMLDQLTGPRPAYLTAVVPGLLVALWLLARERGDLAEHALGARKADQQAGEREQEEGGRELTPPGGGARPPHASSANASMTPAPAIRNGIVIVCVPSPKIRCEQRGGEALAARGET